MADLHQMSRILYHHNWLRVEDWARNIEQLADLTDEEIGQLEGSAASAPIPRLHSRGCARTTASLVARVRDGSQCSGAEQAPVSVEAVDRSGGDAAPPSRVVRRA